MARQEGAWPQTGMPILLPEAAVVGELLGDHRIHINVLCDVIIVLGGVLKGASTVGGNPDGWMGLLVGWGRGQGLIKLPVFALVGNRVLRPRLDNDFERLGGHLMALLKGQVPAQKFVPYDPCPCAE